MTTFSEDPADPPIKTTSSKIVYQNPWIKIHEDQTIMTNGKPGIYGYMESRDSVMTAILDDQDRLLMVRGFRYPTKSWGWELAGGGTDEGEDPAAAALRELEEETGIRVAKHQKIGATIVCCGLMTERNIVFVGYELTHRGERQIGEEAVGEMRFFTMDEVDALVDAGEINDNQTITGLFYLNRWLANRAKSSQ